MSILNSLKSIVKQAGDQIAAMRRSLERFKAEKAELEAAPLSRDDLIEVVNAFIDRDARSFEKNVFEHSLSMFNYHPLDKYRTVMADAPNAPRLKILNSVTPGRFDDGHEFLQSALFFVIGDLLKAEMAKLIRKRWPETFTKPIKERLARIAELEREINKIEKEEAEIHAEARKSGFRLPSAPADKGRQTVSTEID